MVPSPARSRFLSAMIAALLLMLAAGPLLSTARAQGKVQLLVWDQFTDPAESKTADSIYKDFTRANPNVTIKREAFSTDQIRQTVNTALSSGTGPDIIFYDAGPGYAGVLANAGLVQPLDEMAAKYGWKDRINPSALEGTTIGGKLYGLPLQVDLIGMYYNKKLLDQEGLKVPTTLDEMLTFCKSAKDKGYIPIAFADKEGWEAFHQFSMAVNQTLGPNGVKARLVDHQGSWNTPETVAAIKAFFVDMRDAGCFSKDANALSYDDGNSLFYSGQSLLHTTGSWLVNEIESNMPDADIGFVPFPAIPGGKGQVWVSGVGSAYYISSKSQHQAEAGQFLDYLFSAPVVQRWVSEANFIVPAKVDTGSLKISPLFKSILDTLQQGTASGTQFGYNVDVLAPPQFNDVMTNGFQAMLAGKKTPEQQATDLEAAWEAWLKSGGAQATPSS